MGVPTVAARVKWTPKRHKEFLSSVAAFHSSAMAQRYDVYNRLLPPPTYHRPFALPPMPTPAKERSVWLSAD